MEFDNHILLVISVASLIFSNSIISVKGSEEDDVKKAFRPFLDEAKEALGPVSSWDFDKVKDTFSPSFEEAKEELGPISSIDQVKEALSPLSSSIIDKAKEAITPSAKSKASQHITSWLDEAQKEIGPVSSSDEDEDAKQIKDEAGPVSSSDEEDDEVAKQNKDEASPVSSSDEEDDEDAKQNKDEAGPVSSSDEEEEEDAKQNEDESQKEPGPVSSLDEEDDEQNKEDIEAQKELGPISSSDLDNEDVASTPASTFNKAKQKLGSFITQNKEEIFSDSPSILDEAQKELGPISDLDASTPPSTFDEAKEEALGSISSQEERFSDSPSILDEAQKELGPISSDELAKQDEDASSPVPSSTFNEAKEALGSISSQAFNVAKQKLGSIRLLLSQNKEETSSDSPDEAQEEVGPISSDGDDLDKDEDALSPTSSLDVSPTTSNENKEEIFSDSSSVLDEAQKELGPISSDLEDKDEDASSPVSSSLDEEAEEALGSISSEVLDKAEGSFGPMISETSSDSSEDAQKELGPLSSFNLDKDEPISSPSGLDEEEGSISSEGPNPISAKMKLEIHSKAKSVYFDHDVALAIESLIKQGQSNSQLAIEEAEKLLLSDASSETRTCVKKCITNYASCIDNLHKAMQDLRARNAELLTDDMNAVEREISICQKCFLENKSPLKDLEEATIKTTRECLNVLDHSS